MRRSAVVFIVFLTLGACSDDPEPSTSPPADQPQTTTTPIAAAATTTSAASGPAPLQLRPDGLGGFAFGAAESEVLPALAEAFGHADSDDPLPEAACSGGATRSVTWGDLHVLIGPDEAGKATLYGWTYGGDRVPATPALVTAEGIGIGSTRDQLQAAYGARVEVTEDEAIGAVRFTVQGSRYQLGLSGLLTGPAANDTVRALFAGSYCGE